METDVEELGEGSNKHISEISSVNAEAREQEGVASLLREIGAGSMQVDEDSVPLQVGDVVKR